MYKNKRFLAVVPARGGSRGIPHKNIILVNGKELITYTLDAAKKSKYLDEVIVSTEDDNIAKVARREGIRVLLRPAILAQDNSKTIDVLLDVINTLDEEYDYLVLLQPTQPLRHAEHIDGAIEVMIDQNYSSLVSVFPVQNHPLLIRKMDQNRKLSGLLETGSTVRRQDFEKYYVVNGAIYINRIKDLDTNSSLNDNDYGYEMPSELNLDIDEPKDIELLEYILCRQSKKEERVFK